MYFRAGSSPAGRKRIREDPFFFLSAEENRRRFILPFYKNSFGMLKCLRRIMIRSRLKSLERGAPNSVRYI